MSQQYALDIVNREPEPEGPSLVEKAMRLIRADRPNWKPTPDTVRLWQDEFGKMEEEQLLEAVRRWLRKGRGAPSIGGVHEMLNELAEARRYDEERKRLADDGPLDWRAAQGAGGVPSGMPEWYDPNGTMMENLRRLQESKYGSAQRWVYESVRRERDGDGGRDSVFGKVL